MEMEKNSYEGEEHIEHFLHEHPLTLLQVHHDKYCKICTQKIHGPVYVCASSSSSCEFYLHKSCGDLQQEIRHHPVHHPDHSLILREPASYSWAPIHGCDGCYSPLRGFVYRCRDCNFDLHSDCAQYMTPTVKFQGHDQHLLTLVENMRFKMACKCKACLFDISCTFFLRCVECNVNFHVQCGPHPLPLTIVDQHHSHPLSLTIPERLVNDDDDDFSLLLHCDTCNKERNPKHPFYSCAECGYSVHVRCVITEVPRKPSIKLESHDHAVIYMEELGGNPKCRANCKSTTRHDPYLRCVRCADFNIHFKCIPLPQNIKHWSHPHSLKLMNNFVDYNYDEQMCDICETKRDPRDFVYYCAKCYFVAEFECVFHEVIQSLEKEPRDVQLRTIKERNPDGLTLYDVYSSLTEEEEDEKDDIKENVNNGIDEILKTLSVVDQMGKVRIMEKYPYSDEALMHFFCRLYNSLPEETPLVELWSMDDSMVDIKLGGYTISQKLAPVLKDLQAKYSDFDAHCTLRSENCKTIFITKLCGVLQSMRKTKVMDVTDSLIFEWWFHAKCLECAGFKIDFVFGQLKRIVCANYATDTAIYRNKRLYEIRRETDNISRQIEDLTVRKEKLIKETRGIISTALDSDQDSSPSTDIVQFRMNKAPTGLL